VGIEDLNTPAFGGIDELAPDEEASLDVELGGRFDCCAHV
jgi:hypothetical protein